MGTHSQRRIRQGIAAVLVGLVALFAVSTLVADAAPRQDPRRQREQVQKEKAAAAAEVDALRADEKQVRAALDALDANVRGQRARLEDAQRAAGQAAAAAEQARAELAAAEQRLADLRATIEEIAVSAYIHPPAESDFAALQSTDPNDAVRRTSLMGFRTGRDADLLDQLRAAEEDLSIRRDATEAAHAAAEERRAGVASELTALESARSQQAAFANQVEARLDAALSEAASLEALDRSLAQQIAAEQARLAARARSSGGGGGSSSGSRRSTSAGTIVSVRGIQVHESIADNLEALLSAAEADGFRLGGGGYRDPSAQIAVRRANCGTSDYAVYDMPPSQCSPPTARPGTSMHERGLAIDFTYNGRVINSRSNPAFQWLSANAGRYGFRNLPSEPWHWSTNGQ